MVTFQDQPRRKDKKTPHQHYTKRRPVHPLCLPRLSSEGDGRGVKCIATTLLDMWKFQSPKMQWVGRRPCQSYKWLPHIADFAFSFTLFLPHLILVQLSTPLIMIEFENAWGSLPFCLFPFFNGFILALQTVDIMYQWPPIVLGLKGLRLVLSGLTWA